MSRHPGISPGGEADKFEDYLLRVNPRSEVLGLLAEQADETPVIMLNLLRFNPRGDSSIYNQYAKKAAPEVEKTGSFVGYYGRAITHLDPSFGFDDSWDGVGLVVYHRRQSFIDLQSSQNYQLAIPFRTAGASRRTLYVLGDDDALPGAAMSIAELDANRRNLDTGDGAVYVLELLKFGKNGGEKDFDSYVQATLPLLRQHAAVLELSTRSEFPVLSEETWDYCNLTRFPTLESVTSLYENTAWKELQTARRKFVARNLCVVSQAIPIPKA